MSSPCRKHTAGAGEAPAGSGAGHGSDRKQPEPTSLLFPALSSVRLQFQKYMATQGSEATEGRGVQRNGILLAWASSVHPQPPSPAIHPPMSGHLPRGAQEAAGDSAIGTSDEVNGGSEMNPA